MQNIMFLTDDQKNMWAEAGSIFPGERLDKVVQRALADFTINQPQTNFYEVRRFDAPHAFDTLLKLQSSTLAKRHIEVDKDKDECREVLRVEATLFDLVMQAIAMLLDVFLRLLGGLIEKPPTRSIEPPAKPPVMAPFPKRYAPSWQKHQPLIEHDDDGYTP